MLQTYVLAVLGLPVRVTARSLRAARRKVLRRWLRVVSVRRPSLPVAPTVILVDTDDPRAVVCDARLAARLDGAEGGLIHAFDAASKEPGDG